MPLGFRTVGATRRASILTQKPSPTSKTQPSRSSKRSSVSSTRLYLSSDDNFVKITDSFVNIFNRLVGCSRDGDNGLQPGEKHGRHRPQSLQPTLRASKAFLPGRRVGLTEGGEIP